MAIPLQFQPVSFKLVTSESLKPAVKSALTNLFRSFDLTQGRRLVVISSESNSGIYTEVKLENSIHNWTHLDTEISKSHYTKADRQKRARDRVRLGVMEVICAEYDIPISPWGILVGVRPTKLAHRFLDQELSTTDLSFVLTDVYRIAPSRQKLLMNVAKGQREFFHPRVNNPISIYIGIPFCPTRCSYCSFAAYPLQTHSHLIDNFLEALEQEIKAIGTLLSEIGVGIETVYLGGGTPTVISEIALENLLNLLNHYFQADNTREYTVEAGRPETLTYDKLQMMKEYGVQRISINPQTMRDSTLKLIGRGHTVEQIHSAFKLARMAGFSIINGDLILGLPGENLLDVEYSLKELIALEPANITVHSLALKRASKLSRNLDNLDLQQEIGQQMAQISYEFLTEAGYNPYYLYRQRHILSDLENIGYAKPGFESIYNIQMMEERQTIIGLGGGAITKFVNQDYSLVRHANPKCPATYSSQITDLISTKKYQIKDHLSV